MHMSTFRYHVMADHVGAWESVSAWDELDPAKRECDDLQRRTSSVLYEVWDDEKGATVYTP